MHWSTEILKDSSLSVPAGDGLEIEVLRFIGSDAGRAALLSFGGHGWVCLASEVFVGKPADLPDGQILNGELVGDDGTSLHVRRCSEGYIAHRIHRATKCADQLIFLHSLATVQRGTIHYEVAWRPDDEGVWRPWASRLAQVDPYHGGLV